MYHIGDIKRATYKVVSGTKDAETDREKTVRECDRRCHEKDEPLGINTAEEESQEGDETPELIETDEEEDEDEEPKHQHKHVQSATITETGPNSEPS